jgi:hypothetical protein
MVICPLNRAPDVAVGLPGVSGAPLSEEASPTWLWLVLSATIFALAAWTRTARRRKPDRQYSCEMRPLRYSINVTFVGCCDHRAIPADEDLHRHAVENLNQADALLFGRVTYEMMESAWRPPMPTGARPDWMEPFARIIDAAKEVRCVEHPGPGRLVRLSLSPPTSGTYRRPGTLDRL